MSVVVLCLAVLFGGATTSDAALVFTLQEQGSNVVLSGSGSIDLTGFSSKSVDSTEAVLSPNNGVLGVGSFTPFTTVDVYEFTSFIGPNDFGLGGSRLPISASGQRFGLSALTPDITVPAGYISGNSLNGSAVFFGTLADVGATLGTYKWTLPNDTITLNVVPIPGAVWLLGSGLVGLIGIRRKLKK